MKIGVPELVLWLLRLAVDGRTGHKLLADPIAFSAWYAVMGSAVRWPDEVVGIQKRERARPLSLKEMMKLLQQLQWSFRGTRTAGDARRILEGYAVHKWADTHRSEFREICSVLLQSVGMLPRSLEAEDFSLVRRMDALTSALKVRGLAREILVFALVASECEELTLLLESLGSGRWVPRSLWTVIFDTTEEKLRRALRPRSPLRVSGLLEATGRNVYFLRMPRSWVDLLMREEALFEALLEPMVPKLGSGRPAQIADEDRDTAIRLLNATGRGVQILLYGPSSLERGRLLRDLLAGCGRRAYRVRRFSDAPPAVLPSVTYVAFHLLAQREERTVLIVERPTEVLQTNASEWFRALFGVELTTEKDLAFDENLIRTAPVPGIWLASDLDRLPDHTIAQFIFPAPLKQSDPATQRLDIEERFFRLRLGAEAMAQLQQLDGVSEAQLHSAVRAARVLGHQTPAERDRAIVHAVRRTQRALARNLTARFRPPVTTYSLELINYGGRFSPAQVLGAIRRRRRGSLLLFGPPGTGKTQYVEHLALELKRPLVAKSASELLSKWVGESEKNIATAFEEAVNEEAILFFDEGDSLLRNRERADHSWEVTQTNELLQRIERFEGIVIVATNLFRDLDSAALRRFDFKLEFRELDPAQRWKMFVTEAGLSAAIDELEPAIKQDWEVRLALMPHLTPGDFAVVKRQMHVLDVKLTPAEWLTQLELECRIKSTSATL